MPLIIPIILGAISLATAGKGIKSGLEAYEDMNVTKNINAEAERIVTLSNETIAKCKRNTADRIELLGMSKLEILTSSMEEFVTEFSKIKNIEFRESVGLDELKHFNVDSREFIEIQETIYDAKKVAVNGLAAVGGSTLLAYGSYSAVMSGGFALATTGTAITGLSGAAATNATLAWLGGGALGTGLGMTGGMVVLGGLVIGPALAIGGSLFASQARKALNDAYSNKEKAEIYHEQGILICMLLDSIKVRASQLNGILNILNGYFIKSEEYMKVIMKEKGLDWALYSKDEQNQIYLSVQLAKTIKIILDTSLLNEDGELNEESLDVLSKGHKYIMQL